MSVQRQSNFELLRIIAILLVLILHADFYALEGPSAADIITTPTDSMLRILFQAIAIVAVNVFVMISGWFGINPSKKGFFNLIFQILFYSTLIYVGAICFKFVPFTIKGMKDLILATSSNWFIKAYLQLYILSPVLNCFVKQASKSEFELILVGFFVFQTIYGWLFPASTDYIAGGYSPISFIGIYLLARYVRIHRPKWMRCSIRIYCITYLIMILCITTICFAPPVCMGIRTMYAYNLFTYVSPTTIGVALLMILITSKLNINNSFVNRLASSSFAVYLVFVNPNILKSYGNFFKVLHDECQGVYYWLMTLGIVILLYIVVACFDTIRLIIWKCLSTKTS